MAKLQRASRVGRDEAKLRLREDTTDVEDLEAIVDEVYDHLSIEDAQLQAEAALTALNEEWDENTPIPLYLRLVLASVDGLGQI